MEYNVAFRSSSRVLEGDVLNMKLPELTHLPGCHDGALSQPSPCHAAFSSRPSRAAVSPLSFPWCRFSSLIPPRRSSVSFGWPSFTLFISIWCLKSSSSGRRFPRSNLALIATSWSDTSTTVSHKAISEGRRSVPWRAYWFSHIFVFLTTSMRVLLDIPSSESSCRTAVAAAAGLVAGGSTF